MIDAMNTAVGPPGPSRPPRHLANALLTNSARRGRAAQAWWRRVGAKSLLSRPQQTRARVVDERAAA